MTLSAFVVTSFCSTLLLLSHVSIIRLIGRSVLSVKKASIPPFLFHPQNLQMQGNNANEQPCNTCKGSHCSRTRTRSVRLFTLGNTGAIGTGTQEPDYWLDPHEYFVTYGRIRTLAEQMASSVQMWQDLCPTRRLQVGQFCCSSQYRKWLRKESGLAGDTASRLQHACHHLVRNQREVPQAWDEFHFATCPECKEGCI